MTINALLDDRLFFISGDKGRPTNQGSVTYWLRRLLADNHGKRAQDLALALIDIGAKGSIPHISMVLDRVDGAMASDVNIRGVIAHIGDEYASQGLEAIRKDIDLRQQRSLSPQSPQEPRGGLEVQNLNKGVDGKWGVE